MGAFDSRTDLRKLQEAEEDDGDVLQNILSLRTPAGIRQCRDAARRVVHQYRSHYPNMSVARTTGAAVAGSTANHHFGDRDQPFHFLMPGRGTSRSWLLCRATSVRPGEQSLCVWGGGRGAQINGGFQFQSLFADALLPTGGTGSGTAQFTLTWNYQGGNDSEGNSLAAASFSFEGIQVWSDQGAQYNPSFYLPVVETFNEPFMFGTPFIYTAFVSASGSDSDYAAATS
jgi:hypothetical protein